MGQTVAADMLLTQQFPKCWLNKVQIYFLFKTYRIHTGRPTTNGDNFSISDLQQ